MRKKEVVFSLSLWLLFGCSLFGQKKKIDQDDVLFQQAVLFQSFVEDELVLDYYLYSDSVKESTKELAVEVRKKMLIKAIDLYDTLLEEYPNSSLAIEALYNVGYAQLTLQEYDKAKETFQRIIATNPNDKGKRKKGVKNVSYGNYKNRAVKELVVLELKDNAFQKALTYLELTKEFPYQHFCGNAYAEDDIYISLLYAKCYIGLNQTDKALQVLFPNLIENGLADNSEVVHFVFDILKSRYEIEVLSDYYKKSFENVQIKKIKEKNYEYEVEYITFLGIDIVLQSLSLSTDQEERRAQEINQMYSKSLFYKLLNGDKGSVKR